MGGRQNAFTMDDSKLWRKGVVWYTFGLITYLDYDGFTEVSEPWFSEEDEQLIKDAMAIIEEQVPCIDFRKKPHDLVVEHIIFSASQPGCSSNVGMQKTNGAGQHVNLGGDHCFNIGKIVHLLMHALGASEEYTRVDRDIYIYIDESQHTADDVQRMKVDDGLFNSQGTPFDFKSIMYEGTQLGIFPKVNSSYSTEKEGLSSIDVIELVRAYESVSAKSCITRQALENYADELSTSLHEIQQIAKEESKGFSIEQQKEYLEVKNHITLEKYSSNAVTIDNLNIYVKTMEEHIQKYVEILSAGNSSSSTKELPFICPEETTTATTTTEKVTLKIEDSCLIANHDYYGNDIDGGKFDGIENWRDCSKKCQENKDCKAFAYATDDPSYGGNKKVCYLKNNATVAIQTPGIISGHFIGFCARFSSNL